MKKIEVCDLEYILTHPDNLEKVKKMLKVDENHIHTIREIPIYTNKYLEPYTLHYERTNVLQDTPFFSYVNDIEHPPSWAVYFGLVVIHKVPNIILRYRNIAPLFVGLDKFGIRGKMGSGEKQSTVFRHRNF